MTTQEISVSRTVAAAPDRVWQIVSDLGAMGRRSPQCRSMTVPGPVRDPRTVTVNVNRRGPLVWVTWAVVTRWRRDEVVEFRIPLNGSRWRFELAPAGEGTLVTERRLVEGRTTPLSRVAVALALGGEASFERELRAGMEATLDAVAREAEAAP